MYINVKNIDEMIDKCEINHIYLDFDEVASESIDAVLIQLNDRFHTAYKMSDIHKWDFSDCFPSIHGSDILEIFDSKKFFDDLKWKDGAIEFIEKYKDIITIPTKGNKMNLYLKEIYIRSYFKDIDFIGLDGTNADKSMVRMGEGSLHIDDNESNLYSTNAQYKILFENVPNAEWNMNWDGMRMRGWK